ncbi:hypothetical protein D7X55_09475 [Corallococcus sp. AB049A]|uniref:Lipoprotein n=1 Tax=Corallococcus interemptor TaxID=2316720 RepID=A0A3A8QHA3_9BACT|nr:MULTISPECIES: hypothetical protein [Corallococcus]RKH49157.1 hypothetical protein D7Y23_17700 [Corallococcus sp. AB050B]RKH66290.1 hypothetical protein D7X96_21830 [Corallococcus interemptor]RKI70955.1 hypothetical protein D7X55_09475 [Corallococcus sp. AB049A]
MWRSLMVAAVCVFGLTACGGSADVDGDLVSQEQGLACEAGTGACPGTTVCAYNGAGGEGLCRPACVNGRCSSGICCTQPNGAPYCNSFCY